MKAVTIPEKLQDDNFRFILTKPNKAPLEKSWQYGNNYSYSNQKLITHLMKGGNYGVVGGFGSLIIIDWDNEELRTKLMPKLPETFTVRTGKGGDGKGGFHQYFISKDGTTDSFKILNKKMETMADIQGTGKQVIGPGSLHPTGGRYQVVNDRPLTEIEYAELKAIFGPWVKQQKHRFQKSYKQDNIITQIKQELKVPDLLQDLGIDTSRNPTACPLHSSKGGRCLSFTDDVWNCFHCNNHGDVLQLSMLTDNIPFVKAKLKLADKLNIKNMFSKETLTQKHNPYPQKSLAECKEILCKWLHIKDEDVLELVFAFAISEQMPGDPLWLFLIAPPGGCKTELLRAIYGEQYYHLSDLTSKTFISGLMLGKGDTRRKIDDLLPQLHKKTLLMKDFTTVLEKQKDERREIIAQLREIYDGLFSKKFGSMDLKVEYRARFGFIAGVTPIIDKHWKIMQQLGERFLKYRWHEDSGKTTRKAQQNEGYEEEMREEIHNAVMGFLTHVKIQDVQFAEEFVEPLIEIAMFLAICRTPVTIQSSHSDFYFDFIPTPERPTRLVKQLKKFCKCLACIRGKSKVTRNEVLTAINLAFHTCPQDRLDVLRAIQELQHTSLDGCTTSQLAKVISLPRTSIGNICKQLRLLKLLEEFNVSRQSSYGYAENVTYYKVTQEVPALSPLSFLDMSKKVGGDSPRVISSESIYEWVKKNDYNDNVLEAEKLFGKTVVASALSSGDLFRHKPGWIKALD